MAPSQQPQGLAGGAAQAAGAARAAAAAESAAAGDSAAQGSESGWTRAGTGLLEIGRCRTVLTQQ